MLSFVFIIFSVVAKAQIIPADSASSYIDRTVTVYGQVMDARFLSGSTRKPTVLNMGGRYPNQKMTVVIYGDSRGNFGYQPEVMLLNKVIYVKGKVQLYNEKPQMVVSTPFEISLNPPGATTAPTTALAPKNGERTNAMSADSKSAKVNDKKQRREVREKKENVVSIAAPPVQQKPVTGAAGEIVLETGVSLKGGPGKQFTTVGNLKKGTVVRVISSNYGWAKIAEKTSENPLIGYVKVENLNKPN